MSNGQTPMRQVEDLVATLLGKQDTATLDADVTALAEDTGTDLGAFLDTLGGSSGGTGGVFMGEWQAAPDEVIYSEDFSTGLGIWSGTQVDMLSTAIGTSKPAYSKADQASYRPTTNGGSSVVIAGSLTSIPAASGRSLSRLTVWHSRQNSGRLTSSSHSLSFDILIDGVSKFNDTFAANSASPVSRAWAQSTFLNPVDLVQFRIKDASNGNPYFALGYWAIAGITLYATVTSWTGYDIGQMVLYNGRLFKSNLDNNLDEPTVGAGAASWTEVPVYATPKTPNAQTGTTYTLALADVSKVVTLTNAGAVTLTVPANASVAFPIGTRITVIQGGTGGVTFTPAAGVTINNNSALAAQWSKAELIKTATDTWVRT